jgi:hypothetical protein
MRGPKTSSPNIIGFPAHGALEKEGAIQRALEASGVNPPRRGRR